MGSFRRQLLSDSIICRLYQEDGLPRFEIGLRAKLYDKEVTDILRRNGIPLRSAQEAQAMSRARRLRREAMRGQG